VLFQVNRNFTFAGQKKHLMKKRNILIPVSLEKDNINALEQTYNMAKLFDLNITLLFVYEDSGIWSKFFSDKQKKDILIDIEKQLKDLAEKTTKESGCETDFLLRKGRVSGEILKAAEDIDAQYIFMKTISSKEGKTKSISANAFRVIRKSSCPVISINGSGYYSGCRKILLPLDLSNETMQKTSKAVEFAKYFNASIQVISVVEKGSNINAPSKINIQLNQAKKFIIDSKISCESQLIEKKKNVSAVNSMLDYAEQQGDIDLIMIMSQQELGITGAKVGRTAQAFIKYSEIPLMTIKPNELSGASVRSF